MKIQFSSSIKKELKKIKLRDKKMIKVIEKQLHIFELNPKHPSLRVHKLLGNLGNTWSISITMKMRMLYHLIDESTALFFNIGTHDEVYKK